MKPGRNDPCPCGSGQKFKKCCEKQAAVAVTVPAAAEKEAEATATAAAPAGSTRPRTWDLLHQGLPNRKPGRMSRKKPK